ncbi:T9SS type A sorting domain-containing protein [Cryomorpha ignava]|uniref:T9SS type A sorting domain-containing protein n=1 Tax=Cryomorpha ignava TaxID=101383 RepID=A0A7K3WRM9_9FLAO|nr:T9SS type A sorting domain-containing protein [Cryomorpha ignava]NEN23701.1 T9SS type A sorting domain-containing protein [Cryomorpha ignava]
MKLLLSLLFSIALSVSSFSQNGVYLYGFMANAPASPVQIDVSIYGDSSMTPVLLFTEPSGNIQTQWIDLPSGESIQFIGAGYYNCQGNYTFQSWNASEFDDLIDIPLNFNYCADSTLYGCTDPLAINYNPQANQDDGSCQYVTTCQLNDVIVSISTQSWGQEVSWNLLLDSTSVAGGGKYQSNNTYSSNWCLENGCYTFEMFDTFGDGWNESTFQVVVDGLVIQSGTLLSGNYGSVSFGINQEGCIETPPVSGCTDPLALNYNPFATIDDNSCEYATITENDLCANAIPLIPGSTILINNSTAFQNEGIWGECWGFGQGEGEQTSVWYTFTTPLYPASIHLEALYDGSNTLTDTQFGIFEECGGEMIYCDGNAGEGLMSALDFECGVLDENTTYILMIDGYYGDAGTCFLQYEVDSTCTTEVLGCTDPQAINYNPEATEDDGSCEYATICELNEIQVVINTGTWANEISWNLVNADSIIVATGNGYSDNLEYVSQWCLSDGCYTFQMFDSFGDGWNGANFEVILDGDILASGALSNFNYGAVTFGINQEGCANTLPIYGCTDPGAVNYNPEAILDDGSCMYDSDCTPVTIIIDGYNVPYTEWLITSTDGYALAGAMQNQNVTIIDECLEDGCYSLEIIGIWGDTLELGYYTVLVDSMPIAEGLIGSFQAVSFEVGSGCDSTNVIYGCTDPNAYNYNPEATEDDGSCIYQFDCSIDFFVIPDSTGEDVIWIVPSANILAAVEVLWDFGDGTTSTDLFPSHEYFGDGPFTLCLTATFASPDGSSCSITYCVVLTGDMADGSGFTSSEGGFTINVIGDGASVGLTATESITNLSLWPNPTKDQLNMRFNSLNNNVQTVEIMDINGKIIVQKELNNAGGTVTGFIDVTNLTSGVYLFKLSSADQIETRRFVIAK